LIAIFVSLEGAVLWADYVPSWAKRCPDVQGIETDGVDVKWRDYAEIARDLGFKCKRVTWGFEFEDHYGTSYHFECDGRWAYRFPADKTGIRPIRQAAICYTGR